MTTLVNRQWTVAARPEGNVKPSDFAYREVALSSDLKDGEILLKTLYLGVIPVMRMYMLGWPAAGEKPLEIGDVIHGRGVAEVVASNHPDFSPGDVVQGQIGWQTYKKSTASSSERIYKMRDHGLSYSLGVSLLGMTGFSAYFGFFDCAWPKAGDTIVISGAGGGVGSVVVQLARLTGCTVIAIAGGPAKCTYVRDLGAHHTIDYKSEDVDARLAALCPNGLDIYFDNVGGDILATALEHLAMDARVVLCGSISEYLANETKPLPNYTRLRRVNGIMKGFFVYNYENRYREAEDAFVKWVKAGDLKVTEDVTDRFEHMPSLLGRLYEGGNRGMSVCRI